MTIRDFIKENARILRREKEEKMRSDFFHELGEEFGVLESPKFELLCSKAWDLGHSSGFSEVRNYFIELLDLIR